MVNSFTLGIWVMEFSYASVQRLEQGFYVRSSEFGEYITAISCHVYRTAFG